MFLPFRTSQAPTTAFHASLAACFKTHHLAPGATIGHSFTKLLCDAHVRPASPYFPRPLCRGRTSPLSSRCIPHDALPCHMGVSVLPLFRFYRNVSANSRLCTRRALVLSCGRRCRLASQYTCALRERFATIMVITKESSGRISAQNTRYFASLGGLATPILLLCEHHPQRWKGMPTPLSTPTTPGTPPLGGCPVGA